ncbi:MAG: hypothetical protein KY453_00450 [Gemmatimonadetes bacterium]|nr:hypothetical protein [Gemmatimonadota bacterium]
MAARTGRDGLLLALLALLALLIVYDLVRPDSWLRSAGDDRSVPMERIIRDVRDELPRSRPR